jgi:hypothetical protein
MKPQPWLLKNFTLPIAMSSILIQPRFDFGTEYPSSKTGEMIAWPLCRILAVLISLYRPAFISRRDARLVVAILHQRAGSRLVIADAGGVAGSNPARGAK